MLKHYAIFFSLACLNPWHKQSSMQSTLYAISRGIVPFASTVHGCMQRAHNLWNILFIAHILFLLLACPLK